MVIKPIKVKSMENQRSEKLVELVTVLQAKLKELDFTPNFISEVDSDPRYKALNTISDKLKVDIEWNWSDTDYSKIKGEPVVIEFSQNDKISLIDACKVIGDSLYPGLKPINGDSMLIIINDQD